MIRFKATIILILFGLNLQAQNLAELCKQFNDLNTLVLHQKIRKEAALRVMERIMSGLYVSKEIKSGQPGFVFPLKGYTSMAIGGKSGEGFISKGYNYFDGNKHKAHPAHDIFIRDKNQDCLDDKTGKPVDVLAVSSGVVVACEKNWKPGSELRGGNYIWIFNMSTKTLYYYAHNGVVKVNTGDQVRAAQVIATVGRTGLNASKKRSPTHLHFMALQFGKTYMPSPFNTYPQLLKARIIN